MRLAEGSAVSKSFMRNILPLLAIYVVATQVGAEPAVDSQAILESLDL